MNDRAYIECLIAALQGMIKLARIEEKSGSKAWGKAADLAESVIENRPLDEEVYGDVPNIMKEQAS